MGKYTGHMWDMYVPCVVAFWFCGFVSVSNDFVTYAVLFRVLQEASTGVVQEGGGNCTV